MRFCTTCGTQLRPGVTFCTGCGTAVEGAVPNSSSSADDTVATQLSVTKSDAETATRAPVFPRTPPPPAPPPTPTPLQTQVLAQPAPRPQPAMPTTVFPVQPPVRPPTASGPITYAEPSRNWAVVIGVVVVVLALAGTVVALIVTRKSGTPAASVSTTQTTTPGGTSAGGSTGGSQTGSGGTTGDNQPTTAPAPVVPQNATVGIVDITSVRHNAQAHAIGRTFDWYFSNINEGLYTRAGQALSDHQAPLDYTTHDSRIVVQQIYREGGQLYASITFRSTQAPRWAPDGVSRCDDWNLTFPVNSSYNFLPYQLGKPVHSSQPYVSCG